MANNYRLVCFYHNGDGTIHKQVEGYYDYEVDARQSVIEEELWKDLNYIKYEVYKDF